MKYAFKTEPYDHQMTALEHGWKKREYGYFMEMGTGKSKVIVDTFSMLYDSGKVEGVLIIAPKGVYRNWTNKEIPDHLPAHITERIGTWSSRLSKEVKKEINHLFQPNDDLNVLVMNIDALITKKGYEVAEKFLLCRNAMMVIDESTIIKNPSAKRTKAAIKLGSRARYRRILTGSPITKSPLDVYSQCEFLNSHLLGFSSFYSFRNRYAIMQDSNYGGRTFKQVVNFKNTEELAGVLKDFTYRVTKDECLDLPNKIFMRREFEMTKEQKKVYEEMKQSALAFLEQEAVSATSAITQLLRLHQISCGFFPTDEGPILPLKHDRMKELMSTLSEANGKVIIWANYRNDIKAIKEALDKEYGKGITVTYYGDTNDEDRMKAVVNFQDPNSPVRYFLGNTQTGGYGITLTEAKTVVYYSNNYDLEKRLQSEDRAHRIGQHHPVTYVDLVCKNTVDEKIIKALRNKISLANSVTGDKWKEWI
jgi:SNF2 family DNA or RNA helicase|tara:strand:- start:6087 stop:7520 length:1434 start_codon:yes stop_codon:yes gene_type:complete